MTRPSSRFRERLQGVVASILFLAVALACRPAKKLYGEECVDDEQCKVGTCSPSSHFCTHACTYDKDCGKGHVCRFDGSPAGNSCAKAVGIAVGGACQAPEGCQNGHCIKVKPDEPGLCSRYCQTVVDCPTGMKVCDKISNSGLLKLCLPENGNAQATPAPTPAPTPQPTTTGKHKKKKSNAGGW
jgi:hypothetical protein